MMPLSVPLAVIGQSPAVQLRGEAADSERDLAWQSNIGQFIFLQSLAQERI
jgi:hypothetical protein